MSKIDKYNMYMYPSFEVALRELSAPHLIENHSILGEVYTKKAYDEMAAFLCLNDIQHTFTRYPVCTHLGVQMLTVCWKGAAGEQSLAWWEQLEEQE